MLAFLLSLAIATASPMSPVQERPNIIVIISDDAGWSDFGFQGSPDARTPHLDALRDSGVRFTRAYVTASVCSPSRAGLMSGRYQQRFGHDANIAVGSRHGMPGDEVTMAERLRDAGYATAAIGKWHLGYRPEMRPIAQGFDQFHGLLAGSRSYRPYPDDGKKNLHRLRDGDLLLTNEASDFEWVTDHFGRVAAATVNDMASGRPYFLYVSFTAPHTPMQASDDDLAAFADATGKGRTFLAMQRALDRAVGTILDAVEDSGERDQTMIWFVNDNGGATTNASDNGILRGMKGSKFEGGIRVPMLLRWPGVVEPGDTFQAPVSTLDIAATSLSAAGANLEQLDGTTITAHLDGRTDSLPHDYLFWRRGPIQAVLGGSRWKLIRVGDAQVLLFDLYADPCERNDVADEHPRIRDRLMSALSTWESAMAEPGWSSGPKWTQNQVRKHQPDVRSRSDERTLPE